MRVFQNETSGRAHRYLRNLLPQQMKCIKWPASPPIRVNLLDLFPLCKRGRDHEAQKPFERGTCIIRNFVAKPRNESHDC
jgi:hypothetical protein